MFLMEKRNHMRSRMECAGLHRCQESQIPPEMPRISNIVLRKIEVAVTPNLFDTRSPARTARRMPRGTFRKTHSALVRGKRILILPGEYQTRARGVRAIGHLRVNERRNSLFTAASRSFRSAERENTKRRITDGWR